MARQLKRYEFFFISQEHVALKQTQSGHLNQHIFRAVHAQKSPTKAGCQAVVPHVFYSTGQQGRRQSHPKA